MSIKSLIQHSPNILLLTPSGLECNLHTIISHYHTKINYRRQCHTVQLILTHIQSFPKPWEYSFIFPEDLKLCHSVTEFIWLTHLFSVSRSSTCGWAPASPFYPSASPAWGSSWQSSRSSSSSGTGTRPWSEHQVSETSFLSADVFPKHFLVGDWVEDKDW